MFVGIDKIFMIGYNAFASRTKLNSKGGLIAKRRERSRLPQGDERSSTAKPTQKLRRDFLKRACPHKSSARDFDTGTARHEEINGKEIKTLWTERIFLEGQLPPPQYHNSCSTSNASHRIIQIQEMLPRVISMTRPKRLATTAQVVPISR